MKVGIVGCGEVSAVHAEAILATGKCQLVSACDLQRERAEALASRFKIPGIYTDFTEMLQKENLDIVHITTPPQVHEPLTVEALNAGCNVMVEKPMCMTVKEADRMIEAAKKNGVKLGVIHSFLFTPPIRKALEIVKRGEIGDLLWADTVISIKSLLKWQDAKGFPMWYSGLQLGLFGEILPHGFYIQLAFLGKVNKILGLTRDFNESTDLLPYPEVQVAMKCEKGLGSLLISSRIESPYTVLTVRLVGTRRILLVNVPASSNVKLNFEGSTSLGERAMMNFSPAFQMLGNNLSMATKVISGAVKPHMTHRILVKKFVESIENDTDPPVTPEEGREVVRAINMLKENIIF